MTSIISNRGGGIGCILFAVATNMTFDRSNGTFKKPVNTLRNSYYIDHRSTRPQFK
jgi:hypothetical protein